MLDYLILQKKPKYDLDGTEAKNLLFKTLISDENNYSGQFLKVNEYYIARPDLISLAMYGDDSYGDIICKINGISNPFELNKDMVLFIPNIESIYNILNNDFMENKSEIISNTDNISVYTKKGAQKQKNEPRTNTEQIIGDSRYIIDKSLGMVLY